jgi:hypothetical protein
VSVQRLLAHARLDDSPTAPAHAKAEAASGDESWARWVEEFQRGDALILRLELTLEITDAVVRGSADGLFVENDIHAAKIERQIAELASGDFAALAGKLAESERALDRTSPASGAHA